MGFDDHVAGWSALHGGLAPSPLVRRYLRLVHRLAVPVARTGVHPDALTLASLAVALPVLWVPAPVAAGLVLLSGLLDALDGSVALLQGRPTRWGYVLDSVVDRVCDALYLVALVAVGCPAWLAVAAGFACFLLEYLRARAGNAGGDDVVRITMAERPTRVIVLALAIHFSGVFPDLADTLSALGGAVLLGLTVVSVAQLAAAVRHQLQALPAER
jgi:CDP-diacylglycerol--glycerol-3-phosphate 3-phosphatidyltransferase